MTHRVTTINDGLRVYPFRDLGSAPLPAIAKDAEIEIGAATELDGQEWIEVKLPDGASGYSMGSSLREHTTLGEAGPVNPGQVSVAANDPPKTYLVGTELWTEKEVAQIRVFEQRLAAAPSPVITMALIGINVALYIAMLAGMAAHGVSLSNPPADSFIAWGADFGPLTTNGQWWRVITAAFLHFNILHIGMNMYCLFMIGGFAEKVFGRAEYAFLYLLAGIAGNLASLFWHPVLISGGASGAVFGVYGAVLGFVVAQGGKVIPKPRVRHLVKQTAIFLGLNLAYGLAVRGVDVAAHVGGLITGILLGAAFARVQLLEETGRRTLMAAVTAVTAAAICVGLGFRIPRIDDLRAELERLAKLEPATLKIVTDTAAKLASRSISRDQYKETMDSQALAPWNSEREKLMKLRVPKEQQPVVDRIAEFMGLRAEAWQLREQFVMTGNAAALMQAAQKEVAARSVMQAFNPAPKKVLPTQPVPPR